MSKLVPIDGLSVKFRTDMRGGRHTATATIWRDGSAFQEIATLDLGLIERPGDPAYQGWVDAISTAFNAFLSRRAGIAGIVTKRRKPSYEGE